MSTITMNEEYNLQRRGFLGVAATAIAVGILRAADYKAPPALADEGSLPDLGGAIGWLNSAPLNRKLLRGRVVVFDFWTYTCINSLRPLPYVKSWAAKYRDAGLVVIGVHTPEFSFEKELVNVINASRDLKITYPVAIDSNYRIWQAFNNQFWPAQYLVDGKGRIRHHHFGEGEYAEAERAIQALLEENGAIGIDKRIVNISDNGVEAAPSVDVRSPETYIGYRHAKRFASPERLAQDSQKSYNLPAKPAVNYWGLNGAWNVGAESAVLQGVPGKIMFRFHSRDLHMVLGPAKSATPIRFRVTLDGAPPDEDHGVDSAPDGTGRVQEPRLYQLIRQRGHIDDRTFAIEFLDAGAQAFAFTFG